MSKFSEEDYETLLDDVSSMNDLTRFDDLNAGHKFEDKQKPRQISTTSEASETLINRTVGPRRDQLPRPKNAVTVFKPLLYPNVSIQSK